METGSARKPHSPQPSPGRRGGKSTSQGGLRTLKLLALTEGPDHVCYRYRVAPFAQALACAGWQIECQPLARGPLARWRQLRSAGQADAVLLQRKLLPWWQLRALR